MKTYTKKYTSKKDAEEHKQKLEEFGIYAKIKKKIYKKKGTVYIVKWVQ